MNNQAQSTNNQIMTKIPMTEISPSSHPSPLGDCVAMGEMVKNVMLNLFQHLMESISYETLNRVQGDKK
jgi:hypothetical protein